MGCGDCTRRSAAPDATLWARLQAFHNPKVLKLGLMLTRQKTPAKHNFTARHPGRLHSANSVDINYMAFSHVFQLLCGNTLLE